MSEKLDSFSKILLATSAINYMASSIDGVNRDMKYIRHNDGDALNEFHNKGIEERDKLLEEVVKQLGQIMESMGNIINNHDAICAIDQYITTPAFMVINQGHDETEGDFDNL